MNQEAKDLIKIASEYFKKCDFKSALANFELAQKLEPTESTIYHNIALTYSKMDEKDLAIKNYKKVVQIDEKNYKALASLGDLYTEKKRFKEALTYLNKALLINPNYVLTHFFMGNYRLKTGDFDLALDSYKKAKSLGTKSAKIYYAMGMAYKYKGEFGLCENCMKLALDVDPNHKKALIVFSKVSGLKSKMKRFNKIHKDIS